MSENYYAASREWARRPADERFSSLDDLYRAAEYDRQTCRERPAKTLDLRVKYDEKGNLLLNGQTSAAKFTNWSYSQFCALVGAPSRYLASMPANLAADCLNEGLRQLHDDRKREDNRLLIRMGPNHGQPDATGATQSDLTVRAITSPKYSRIWDAKIVQDIQQYTGNQQTIDGRTWELPQTWEGTRAGAYRSDRDMFLFMVNGGSVVTDPTARAAFNRPGGPSDGGAMYRGFILRNSETGGSSLSIETFLFRMVCGNHIIWGIDARKQYRRRHVGTALHYTLSDGMRAVQAWINTPASLDEQRIRALAQYELGKTKEETIATARGKFGLSESQATKAYDLAETQEDGNPRTAWTFAQGITRLSQQQDQTQNDDRYTLDSLAGAMLTKLGRLVAA